MARWMRVNTFAGDARRKPSSAFIINVIGTRNRGSEACKDIRCRNVRTGIIQRFADFQPNDFVGRPRIRHGLLLLFGRRFARAHEPLLLADKLTTTA